MFKLELSSTIGFLVVFERNAKGDAVDADADADADVDVDANEDATSVFISVRCLFFLKSFDGFVFLFPDDFWQPCTFFTEEVVEEEESMEFLLPMFRI